MNVAGGHVTHAAVAEGTGMDYTPLTRYESLTQAS